MVSMLYMLLKFLEKVLHKSLISETTVYKCCIRNCIHVSTVTVWNATECCIYFSFCSPAVTKLMGYTIAASGLWQLQDYGNSQDCCVIRHSSCNFFMCCGFCRVTSTYHRFNLIFILKCFTTFL